MKVKRPFWVRVKGFVGFLTLTAAVLFVMLLPVWGVFAWGLSVESPHEGAALVLMIPAVYAWNGLLFALCVK